MPASAVDVVRVAFDHMVQQLFKPFRLGQWTRLGIVGFLAGEVLTGGGGFNFGIPSRPRRSGTSTAFLAQSLPFNALWAVAIALAAVAILGLVIIFIYVNSGMRFVLFDSIVAKECHVRRFWVARQGQAWRYFLWQLLLVTASVIATGVLITGAAAVGFLSGWFLSPREHLMPLIIGGIVLVLVFAGFAITAGIIAVLAKDFVVPQLALENIGVMDAWGRLLQMMQTEKAAYAGYVGLKIVLNIAAMAVTFFAFLMLGLVLLIPFGGIALVGFVVARAIHLGWNLFTVTLAIMYGGICLAAIFYAVLLLFVPSIVFFPAYSVHFFAERYEPLRRVL